MTRFNNRIGVVIAFSLLLRLAIAPWFHGYQYDMHIYGNWAKTLLDHPLGDFYQFAESPDHLPGDLYIHLALANIFQFLGGDNFYGSTYRLVLKITPALIDCLLVWLAFLFTSQRTVKTHANRLVWILAFAPALVFISAAWGQWDTVSMTIFLGGLVLLWRDRPLPIVSAILFGWVLLIKPPLLLLVLPAVVGFGWQHWNKHKSVRKLAANLLGMLLTAIATVTTLMLPFGMTWFESWGQLSLQGQLQVAADLYPHTTLGAANIWMIPLGSPDRVPDAESILGMSLQTIGLMLMTLSVLWVAYRTIQAQLHPVALIWAMVMLNYSYFLLPTRSHERYLFPAIVMLAIFAALSQWQPLLTKCLFGSSLVYFVNLVVVYRTPPGVIGVMIFELLSLANVIIFLILLFIPMRLIEATQAWLPAGVQTESGSHQAV